MRTDIDLGLEAIRVALGNPEVTAEDIPSNARFFLRREVEFYGHEDVDRNWARPAEGWETSGDEGPEDMEESEWDGETLTWKVAYERWATGLEELTEALNQLMAEPSEMVPSLGLLDVDGIHPAVGLEDEGHHYNVGGWTPIFMVQAVVALY